MGAATGAVAGEARRLGLDGRFMRRLAERLGASRSAAFVLVRSADPQRARAAVLPFEGTVLHTTLTDEAEARLRRGPAGSDGAGSAGG